MYYKSNCYCQKCKAWNVPLIKNSLAKNKRSTIQNYMCRDCTRRRIKKYYDNNTEKVKAIIYKSVKKHQYKQNARAVLNYHIRTGAITKPKHCEICKEEANRIEGHHHDYDKPLEVTWMCSGCHADADRRHKGISGV